MAEHTSILARIVPWAAASEADWDALYREQLPRVYNFFRYRVGNDADAEDLTSQTFEKAWRARHRYRRDLAGFSTWLFSIARNTAIDHYRKPRVLLPLDEAAHAEAHADPESIAMQRSDIERLGKLLESLSERDRELIALKYGAGLTNRAIAKLSDLSESNVGTILHRAVGMLRSGWFEEGDKS